MIYDLSSDLLKLSSTPLRDFSPNFLSVELELKPIFLSVEPASKATFFPLSVGLLILYV